ncbi:MAG: M1 family aminopeptidase, partial [Desulfobacteraceae bacterium]
MHRFRIIRRRLFAWTFPVLFLLHAVPSWALQVDHRLRVALDPSRARLEGVDRVRVRPEGARTLRLTLSETLETLQVEIENRPVDVQRSGSSFRVTLPPDPAAVSLTIRYAGVFNDDAPTLPANTDNPGYGVTGTIGNRGTLLLPGSGWYPHASADKASYRIAIEAPSGTVGVTAGRSLGVRTVEGKTVSTWQVEHPVRGLSLSAGRYRVRETRIGGVTVATYFTEKTRDLEEAYLEASARYIAQYQALFGPYPFAKFAVVENFFPTGYGFPSYTLLGTRVLRLPFILRTSLGHEIAHCWWGNGVWVDAGGGNWSEGLTSYVADYLYREQESEDAAREHRRQWLRNYASLVRASEDFPLDRFQSRYDPVTKTIGYDKAAMVFHMLRQEIRDAAFWGGLRDVYCDALFERVSWDDLQRAFEARSRRDLNPFFRQWVQRAGAPRVMLRDVQRRATEAGWETTGRIAQEAPFYAFSARLAVETPGGTFASTVQVSERDTVFRIFSPQAPGTLRFDPDWNLFRRLHPSEVPQSINDLRGKDGVHIRVAGDAGPGLRQAADTLTVALGLQNARKVAATPNEAQIMEDRDWILVGRPASFSFLGGLLDPIAIEADHVRVEGNALSDPQDLFFGVFEHPRSPDRIVALFLGNTETAAGSVARKIPHYGNYSYLVFRGDRNREKGVWPVVSSPLIVQWPEEGAGTAKKEKET